MGFLLFRGLRDVWSGPVVLSKRVMSAAAVVYSLFQLLLK